MSLAFVLISAVPGKEQTVYGTLLKVAEITELHPLFGEYDLIAKVEAGDLDTIGQIVVAKIRSVDGVAETKTLAGANL